MMVAEPIDIENFSRKEQTDLYNKTRQEWGAKNELCFFLVRIEQIQQFVVKMLYGLKRYGVEEVDDLLKLTYIDLLKVEQLGSKGSVLLLRFLSEMTSEMFVF